MEKLLEKLSEYKLQKIALYGLGTETEKAISILDREFEIFCLLDGFKESGELYGKRIVSLSEAINEQVKVIVVVARPGSCKAIKRRIGALCEEHRIVLLDIRGKDLLRVQNTTYDFSGMNALDREQLWKKIRVADAVSFDLFDTLITRYLYSYTDLFQLVQIRLQQQGFHVENLSKYRLAAEKELSKTEAPTLRKIYDKAIQLSEGKIDVSAEKAVETEWEIEKEVVLPRQKVVEILEKIVALGKPVYIITDTYYSRRQIETLLQKCNVNGYTDIFISCEYETGKAQELFAKYTANVEEGNYLHIGDDMVTDISSAQKHGIETFRLYSGADLFEGVGALGIERVAESLSDHLKIGMFIAHMFNDPFCFETKNQRLEVGHAYDIGYLLCAPMICDFVLWMDEVTTRRGIRDIWLCARDGYVIQKMYDMLGTEKRVSYFLTSRTAAIRAGVESEEDVRYVDGMKFFGTAEESLRVRFGLEAVDVDAESGKIGLLKYADIILEKAARQREYYRTYLKKYGCPAGEVAVFDFVAKGTTQMYLQRLVDNHLKGLYFLQLEPEFMSDKNLDIEPFYNETEKNESVIFDHYYILETILTAPHPSVSEFDSEGEPVYAEETRSERDIRCFGKAQEGILDYFKTYISILPNIERRRNKKLDEIILALVGKVKITDSDFLELTVEDPFFNRMTDIKDVIE